MSEYLRGLALLVLFLFLVLYSTEVLNMHDLSELK